MRYPNGKSFAFTILDDTDNATTDNIMPVYKLLTDCGIIITKTAWPLESKGYQGKFRFSETLENARYRRLIEDISRQGHQIGFHGASMDSSSRKKTITGLNTLNDIFGYYPVVHCNHSQNKENLYWGDNRFTSFMFGLMYRCLKGKNRFYGEHNGSEYYWGDIHKKYIRYTRNFTYTSDLNMLNINPEMPYSVRGWEYLNHHFSTFDAPDAQSFEKLINCDKIDRLKDENGVCIVSTHLGNDFYTHGKVNPGFEKTIRHISKLDGWFAPVSTILDFLGKRKHEKKPIGRWRLYWLELKFIVDRVKYHKGVN